MAVDGRRARVAGRRRVEDLRLQLGRLSNLRAERENVKAPNDCHRAMRVPTQFVVRVWRYVDGGVARIKGCDADAQMPFPAGLRLVDLKL